MHENMPQVLPSLKTFQRIIHWTITVKIGVLIKHLQMN